MCSWQGLAWQVRSGFCRWWLSVGGRALDLVGEVSTDSEVEKAH